MLKTNNNNNNNNMIMSIFNCDYIYLMAYIITILIIFTFFGRKKNKQRIIQKIVPILDYDEEIGCDEQDKKQEQEKEVYNNNNYISSNCSLIRNNKYIENNLFDFKIKIE